MTTSHFLRVGKRVRIVLNPDTESTGNPGDSVSGWFRNSDDNLDKFSDVRTPSPSLKEGARRHKAGFRFRTKNSSKGTSHSTIA
jgi:hypothetical protein